MRKSLKFKLKLMANQHRKRMGWLRSLTPGTTLRHKYNRQTYTVSSSEPPHIATRVVIESIIITNPDEWQKVDQ